MIYPLDLSVTDLTHRPLAALHPLPFDEVLEAECFDGDSFQLSLDMFRRLYNDAVESMTAYRSLAVSYEIRMQLAEEQLSHLTRSQDE